MSEWGYLQGIKYETRQIVKAVARNAQSRIFVYNFRQLVWVSVVGECSRQTPRGPHFMRSRQNYNFALLN